MKERRKRAFKERKNKRPSRLWLLVLAAILALLALLCCNPCTPPPEPVAEVEIVLPAPPEEAPAEPPTTTPPLPGLDRIPRQPRPAIPVRPPGPPSWLDAFRMQVTARSPQLAACFEGSEFPGQMRWTTSVEAVQGSVSQHQLEPMLDTRALSADERACLLGVLSRPRYDLVTGDEPSTPQRVGLVIQF